jgi:hypothetical protein
MDGYEGDEDFFDDEWKNMPMRWNSFWLDLIRIMK